MDFQTEIGLSREKIRYIAKLVRKNFNISTIRFPVLKMLEKFVKRYENNLYYSIDSDDEFDYGVQAYLEPEDEKWSFSVYI